MELPESRTGAGEAFHTKQGDCPVWSPPVYFLIPTSWLFSFQVHHLSCISRSKGLSEERRESETPAPWWKLADGMWNLWFSIPLYLFSHFLLYFLGLLVGICITNTSWDHRPIGCLFLRGNKANSLDCMSDVILGTSHELILVSLTKTLWGG